MFLQKPPPTFSAVHLLHRLYGVDSPVWKYMVDIQSPTAENRREKRKKKETTTAKYNGLPITT